MRLLFSIIVFVIFTSCQQGSSSSNDASETQSTVELQEDVLNIGKMHCEMCVASIEKGLASVEGVEFVKVNLEDSTAVVKYDSQKANAEQFKEVIEKRGYVLKNKALQP